MHALPDRQAGIKKYRMYLTEAVLAWTPRRDFLEKRFLDEVLTREEDDPQLDRVPGKFMLLNQVLGGVLSRLIKKDQNLHHDVETAKLRLNEKGKLMAMRRQRKMAYLHVSTNSTLLRIFSVRTLTDLRFGTTVTSTCGRIIMSGSPSQRQLNAGWTRRPNVNSSGQSSARALS